VFYHNVSLAAVISSSDHPFWQWLARRVGRVAGLSLQLCVGTIDADATEDDATDDDATDDADQLARWMQPLQTLSGIPGVQLQVELVGNVADLDHPFISQWLKQHGQLISHLAAKIHVSEDRLKLKDFSEAAAPCKSIDLSIRHSPSVVLDLTHLNPVLGSLQRLACQSFELGCMRGVSAFSSMSQLVALRLFLEDFGNEDPWGSLARLTSLQQLRLGARASGDPSPLSALTRLSSLHLYRLDIGPGGQVPFSFSSLQPLSTLQQLEDLYLGGHACVATSLQGLAGLGNLRKLEFVVDGGRLESLEGISSGVIDLIIRNAPDLVNLAGIEGCTRLEGLSLSRCGVSTLQALSGLSNIDNLIVSACPVTSLEGLNGTSFQSLRLRYCSSLSKLSEVPHLSALKSLELIQCGVTSLQPLSQLGEGFL
jgi:hypothetical protein